eukprot:gene4023-20191_t
MATNNINPMPVFEPKSDITNTGARWTNWLERFQTYLLAADVKEPQRQRALLLYQAGPEATQNTGETIDEFHTRLRTLAKHCKFNDEDFEIKMQIVCNGKSARLRRKALREPDSKLADMLIDGRKAEMSSAQASGMEDSFQELHVKEIRIPVINADSVIHTETNHAQQNRQFALHSETSHMMDEEEKEEGEDVEINDAEISRDIVNTSLELCGVSPIKFHGIEKRRRVSFAKEKLNRVFRAQETETANAISVDVQDLEQTCSTQQSNTLLEDDINHDTPFVHKVQQITTEKPLQSKEPQKSSQTKKESNFVKGTRKQGKAHAIKKDKNEFSTSSDDEYAYAVEVENKLSTKTQLKLNDSFDLTFQVDGETVNIIDSKTFESLQHQIKLEPAKTKIFAYGSSTPFSLKGCFSGMIESKSCYTVSQFYVVEGSGGNLLSGKTAHELMLIHLVHKVNKSQTTDSKSGVTTNHKGATENKTNVLANTDKNIQGLLNKYQNVCEGEGKLKGQKVKLHT